VAVDMEGTEGGCRCIFQRLRVSKQGWRSKVENGNMRWRGYPTEQGGGSRRSRYGSITR